MLASSQRAAFALDVKQRLEAEYRERQTAKLKRGKTQDAARVVKIDKPLSGDGSSRKEAAAMMGVNHQYVTDAENIRDASPETFEAVKQGRVTISQAKRLMACTP